MENFEDELHGCDMLYHDMLYLHQQAALPLLTVHGHDTSTPPTAPLSTSQQHAFASFKRLLEQHTEYYIYTGGHSNAHEWMQFMMLSGKPGSGKSHLLLTCINHALGSDSTVVVAAPTGILAQTFANTLDGDVHCDTLHSLFCFSDTPENCRYNWTLNQYDVICIDEISQVSVPLFKHIMSTLSKLFVRPLVLLSGDFAQQQPLGPVTNYSNA